MANDLRPSIENLPVELFHRIFDHLDAQTILFSVRSVSRLFQSVVNSYDRYNLDFKIISKCNFHRLCRLIQPQHLISLTLYNNEPIPDQISFFISNYRLRQLTRLRSINLFGIDELELNMILKRINLKCLTSFSLHIQKYEIRLAKKTEQYLSSIMAQSTLRKVEFNLRTDRLANIQWPSNSRIDEKSPFPQITSLILEQVNMTINPVESFLLLTPSRIYLKVIGYYCVLDGKRWEEFIQVDLPHLNKFEFFISSWTSTAQTRDDLQLIIQSFQTPFWIEYKKWFVACEFHLKKPRQIQIYSIPICKTIFHDRLDSEKCFLSASNDLSITKNINEIYLKLDNPHDNNILKRINTPFPNATKVRLDFPRDISKDLTHYLRSIFNVSQLTEVHLKYDSFYNCNKDLLFDLIKLIESSSKLTSLTIYSHICKSSIYPFLNDLCWLLPHQIKYLQIPVTKLEQVEIIFQRCHYLSVVKFETKGSERTAKIAEWFEENTIDSIFRRYNGYDCIWIGKKLNQINENPKRIKLMNK